MRLLRRTFSTAAAAVFTSMLAAGCGDDSSTTNPITNDVTSLTISISSLNIARGDAESAIVSIARRAGYTGNVTLSAEGAPNGITVTFSPATLTGSVTQSEMTVTVTPTAAAGTHAVTVRARGSASDSKTASFTVTVPTPGITVTSGAATANVAQGQSTTVGVSLARTGGFDGNVTLSAEGLPAGVTATFDPVILAGSQTASTLTLAATEATPVGNHTITITGSGTGVDPKTATVTLTVTEADTPGISLSSNPALVSIVAGSTGQSTINIGRSGGFAGNVTFATDGALPNGVTVGFAPNNTGTNSTVMTISTTADAPRGPSNITVQGTGPGISTAATVVTVQINDAPGIGLTLTSSAQSIAQNTSAANTLTLTRLGGFGGVVTLDVAGLPTGVTTTLPATIAADAGTQNTPFVVNVGQTAVPGTYPITIKGVGAGGIEKEVTYTLTVTAGAGYTLGATPSTLSIQQGQSLNSAIALTRTGGFAGAVTLSLQGFPAGISATFSPAAPTGDASTLQLNVAASVDPGTYNGTIRGVAAGLGNVEIPLTVTVTTASSGNTVAWKFCDATDVPIWMAVKDGNGAWTRVNSDANNTFSFDMTQSTGGVTYVRNNSAGGFDVLTFYNTRAELMDLAAAECINDPATKNLTGSVAGLSGIQDATISVGGATAVRAGNNFTVSNVPDRSLDVLAVRSTTDLGTLSTIPIDAILRRNQSYAANSAIPLLDFGSAEAFGLASAQYNLANTLGETVMIVNSFVTQNGSVGALSFGALLPSSTTARTVYGIPSARTQAGDFHQLLATAYPDVNSTRIAVQYNRDIDARTITFGPALTPPTVTSVATSPYVRLRASGNWMTEYPTAIGAAYSQGTRSWTISASRGFTGNGSSYQLEIPDLSGAGGFMNTWALGNGSQAMWTVNATDATTNLMVENGGFRTASRTGTITP